MNATWRTLLAELLDDEMRDAWGWSIPVSAGVERPVGPNTCLDIDAGGLSVPYFCAWIRVDFGGQLVEFLGVDQKTPADMRWAFSPDAGWWERARACSWPRRQTLRLV